VVDSSPVILLAKTGHLDLLRLAGDPVLLPGAVEQEIYQGGPNDPAVQALGRTSWLQVVDPGPLPPVLQPYGLDAGEAAVLTWALAHLGTEALLDDLRARRCAAALVVPHRGSAGLVIDAKRQGLIPVARMVLEQLCQAGLHLSDQVMNRILAQVEE
jgi:predicted nucleic acid-binding protein